MLLKLQRNLTQPWSYQLDIGCEGNTYYHLLIEIEVRVKNYLKFC